MWNVLSYINSQNKRLFFFFLGTKKERLVESSILYFFFFKFFYNTHIQTNTPTSKLLAAVRVTELVINTRTPCNTSDIIDA